MDSVEPLKFFTRKELTGGRWKDAPAAVRQNLINLGVRVLDPWREIIGPIRVSSGWRSADENARTPGAVSDSWHVLGAAVDAVPLRSSLWVAAAALVGLPFDKAIVYPSDGHIHVQGTADGGPRNGANRGLWYRYVPGRTPSPYEPSNAQMILEMARRYGK